WRERDIAILLAFALTDSNDHALGVDVGGTQRERLAQPQAGGIDRHQQDAVSRQVDRSEKIDRFADRKDDRQVPLVASVVKTLDNVGTFENLLIKEPQCTDRLVEQDVRSMLLIAQPDLIRGHMLGPELIGRPLVVQGEMTDSGDVRLFGSR